MASTMPTESGAEPNTTIAMCTTGHVHDGRKARRYTFRGPAALLEDFYAEVRRILQQRGIL